VGEAEESDDRRQVSERREGRHDEARAPHHMRKRAEQDRLLLGTCASTAFHNSQSPFTCCNGLESYVVHQRLSHAGALGRK
jgi:hypothetical protein